MPIATGRLLRGSLLALSFLGTMLVTSPAPAAAAPGTVKVSGTLKMRKAPSTRAAVSGTLRNKARVNVDCYVLRERVRGPVATTNRWYRLANRSWVSAAYVSGGSGVVNCEAPPPPPPAPVAPPAGPTGSMTNAQFIAASVAPAQRGQREFGVPASVTIAQAILESGWGRSGLTATDRNYFGIKCFNGVYGPIAIGCRSYATTECLPTCAPTTATFRVYASMTDSYRDHGRFLKVNSRYAPAFAHTGDANQFLYEIWKAGYATDPQYVEKTKKLMQQYNLYQYDLR